MPKRLIAALLAGLCFALTTHADPSSELETLDDMDSPPVGYCDHPLLVSDLIKDIGHGFELEAIALTQATLSVQEEIALGAMMNDSIRFAVGDGYFDSKPELVDYLNQLLADVLPFTTRSDLAWQVHLIDDPTPNAFAAPGGYIYVMTGLLDIIDNEAQLMGVLAHEVGHEELRHAVAPVQYLILLGLWDPDSPRLAGELLPLLKLPFSSRLEQAADAFGVKVLFELGYSPHQFSLLYQKMEELFVTPFPEDIEGSFANVLLQESVNLIEGHPRPKLRACSIESALARLRHAQDETAFYIGEANYRNLTPLSAERF